jgi:hypothetical protein
MMARSCTQVHRSGTLRTFEARRVLVLVRFWDGVSTSDQAR